MGFVLIEECADEDNPYEIRRRASKRAHQPRHSRTVALTEGRGGCQTNAGRIERKPSARFSLVRVFAVQ